MVSEGLTSGFLESCLWSGTRLHPEKHKQVKQEYNKVRSRFKGRRGWSELDLKSKVGLDKLYLKCAAELNLEIHASVIAVATRVFATKDTFEEEERGSARTTFTLDSLLIVQMAEVLNAHVKTGAERDIEALQQIS